MVDWILIVIIILALVFDFINGFHDTANAIATSVMTNAIKIPYAIMMAAVLNFVGAIINTHVAHTIGTSIVDPSVITSMVVIATLISAIFWNVFTWKYGLPSSSSHALVGSLTGIVLVSGAPLKMGGIITIVIGLVLSPILGMLGGIGLMVLFYHLFRNKRVDKVNGTFKKMQLLSAGFMAFSHGGNDAQKSMGIITMALVAGGLLQNGFAVPQWVMISCALAMALGTAVGGWRIIKTVGRDIIELKPIQGCAAETSAASVIQLATHFGLPISTTHVITSAICGAGAAEDVYKVNWSVIRKILLCWLFTLPIVAAVGAIVYKILTAFGAH